jgi:hypothetical protein
LYYFTRLGEPSASKSAAETLAARNALKAEKVGPFDQLIDILASRRGFGVSDSRELIYAPFWLIEGLDLEVNYKMTTARTFQTLVEKCISATHSFRILAYLEKYLYRTSPARPGNVGSRLDFTSGESTSSKFDPCWFDLNISRNHISRPD